MVGLGAGACSSGSTSHLDGAAPTRDAATLDGALLDANGADAATDALGREAPMLPADARDNVDGRAPDGTVPRDGTDAPPPGNAHTVGELYCPPAGTAYPAPLPADRQVTLVPIAPPGGISFLEGPVWLADRGVLLFSEWNGGHRILQLTPPQAIEVFLPATGSNGLTLTADGKSLLMVTELPTAGVARVSLTDRSIQRLVQNFNGESFVQPNDLAVRADGIIYFTDYQAGRLYRRATDGTLSLVSSQTHANGVGLSPDEKTLYLNADTHTMRFPLAADGTAGQGTDVATALNGADGMAIDCAGNIFIAQNNGGSLVVLSASGNKLGEIGGLPQTVTNAAFGGPDRRTLYITTDSALYTIQLAVPGLPS